MKLYQKLLVGSLALTLGLGNLYAMEGQSLPCMSHGPDVNRALPYEIPGVTDCTKRLQNILPLYFETSKVPLKKMSISEKEFFAICFFKHMLKVNDILPDDSLRKFLSKWSQRWIWRW